MEDERLIFRDIPRHLIRPGIDAIYHRVLRYPAHSACPHHRGENLMAHLVDGRGHAHSFPHGASVVHVEQGRGDIDTLVFVRKHHPGR